MKRLAAIALLAVVAVMLAFVPEASCAKRKSSANTSQPVKKSDPRGYYKGLTQAQAEQADREAKRIADYVMSQKSLTLDVQRVKLASGIVARYCKQAAYGNDENRYYRTPYGVFIAGIFTCAGSTRALGRVLDFMGYDWRHVNENQWAHQWCVLEMDGQEGYADGMVGLAGYGKHPSM
ncbi:MAG: hypothetical protein IJP89_06200 [Synergistaceae bacterium]|nr:hypothetical protein [Synergistaceae bacterium]